MEFIKGKSYVTANIETELVHRMHIDRWYKPGLRCVYVRRHSLYRLSDPPELRRHVVEITIEGHDVGVNFWVFECAIKEKCVWDNV